MKQSEENIVKSIRNLLKLKKEKEAIKDRIIRNHLKNFFKKVLFKREMIIINW